MKINIALLLAVFLYTFPAFAADSGTMPIIIRGDVMKIGPGSDRKTVSDELGRILSPEFLSLSTKERIQYDFFPMEDSAPLTVLFDFDPKGLFLQAIIAADSKEDNPVARDLTAWLETHAGEGKKVDNSTVWNYAGMLFTLTEVLNAGEDSIYQLNIEKQ